ncbi:MAG: thioesterase family protein [Granulosicoccaceae bacterium]
MLVDEQQLSYDYTVETADLATAVAFDKRDCFPEVLATARMIALMEIAAARLMESLLKPGELSVGVAVDVVHQAATPAGEAVTVTATYKGLTGKLHSFEVQVADAGGVVGKGVHTRAIINGKRLITSAQKRVAEGTPKS